MIGKLTVLHIVLMGIIFAVFLLAAFAGRSKVAFEKKVRKHKMLAGLGIVAALVVLLFMVFMERIITSSPHFILGIVSFALSVLLAISGFVTLKLKSGNLKAMARSKHITVGFFFVLLMVITIVIGISIILQ